MGVAFPEFFETRTYIPDTVCIYIMQIYRHHFMRQMFQNMGHLGSRYISVHCFPVKHKRNLFFTDMVSNGDVWWPFFNGRKSCYVFSWGNKIPPRNGVMGPLLLAETEPRNQWHPGILHLKVYYIPQILSHSIHGTGVFTCI